MTTSYDWTDFFKRLNTTALERFASGNRNPASWFSPSDTDLLGSIGCTSQELYDFAEDSKDLSWETALLITAVRRDYFLTVQKSAPSARTVKQEDLPLPDATLHEIPWFPRIIAKARARLRGELPDDLMYACGGDRRFLKKFDLHPADFLRHVWAAGEEEEKIARYVMASPGARHGA